MVRKTKKLNKIAVVIVLVLLLFVSSQQMLHASGPVSERDFFGTVVSVGLDSVDVRTSDDAIVKVSISDESNIRLSSKRQSSINDLFQGDSVAVSMTDDLLSAAQLFVIPGKTQFRHIPGIVVSVSKNKLVLQPLAKYSDQLIFETDSDTRIKFREGATEVLEGLFAVVLGKRDPDTGELSRIAIEIHVSPGRVSSDAEYVKSPDRDKLTTNRSLYTSVKLVGKFGGVENNKWTIGRNKVTADANTKIESGIVVGQFVTALGVLNDNGSYLAKEISGRSAYTPNKTIFDGVFQGLNTDNNWIVNGHVVVVTDNTDTDGLPFTGQEIHVVGFVRSDGAIVAREIENRVTPRNAKTPDDHGVRLGGVFEGIDKYGGWMINGVQVSVGTQTQFDGNPKIGSYIEVHGVLVENKIRALRLDVLDDGIDGRDNAASYVKLKGIINAVTVKGNLFVSGHRVGVSELTVVDGDLEKGVSVGVVALIMTDGSLVAKEIYVHNAPLGKLSQLKGVGEKRKEIVRETLSPVRIEGVIEATYLTDCLVETAGETIKSPGCILKINGITVIVTEDLLAGRILEKGTRIHVRGYFQDDGSLRAQNILGGLVKNEGKLNVKRIQGLIEKITFENGEVVSVKVNGQDIFVELLTMTHSPLRVGMQVNIVAMTTSKGLVAKEIKIHKRLIEIGEKLDPVVKDPSDTLESRGEVARFSDRIVTLRDGTSYYLNPESVVIGQLYIGAEIVLSSVKSKVGLIALEIRVIKASKPADFDGVVKEFTLTQIVLENDTVISINKDSSIKDIIKIGDSVKGVAREKADGSSTLLEIEKSKMSKAIKEAPSK